MLGSLVCAGLLSACGSKSSESTKTTNLNTARVARSIEQSITSQRHLVAKVSCPSVVPQEAGRKFECVATTTSPKHPKSVVKTPFEVTIQNSHGYVTYVGK